MFLIAEWNDNDEENAPIDCQLEYDERTARLMCTHRGSLSLYIELKSGIDFSNLQEPCIHVLIFGERLNIRGWMFSSQLQMELAKQLIQKQNPNMKFWAGFKLNQEHVPIHLDVKK
jgi:hypothetical protein